MVLRKSPFPIVTLSVTLSLEIFISPGFAAQRQELSDQTIFNQRITNGWEIAQFVPDLILGHLRPQKVLDREEVVPVFHQMTRV